MIIDIRLPRLGLPRLHKLPSKDWQVWWVIFPRLVHIDGHAMCQDGRRRLILPGKYETRISASQHRRLWREPAQ
jgi:hypothetical protein